MLVPRFVSLLVILLAVQAWSKPAKSVEGDEEYSDDPQTQNSDYEQETGLETDDDPGAIEEPPQITSKPKSVHVRTGETVALPCLVKNTERIAVLWTKDDDYLFFDEQSHITLREDQDRIRRLPNNTLVIYNATITDTSNSYKCSILTQPPIEIKHRVLVDPETVPPPPPSHKPLVHVTPGKKVVVNANESIVLGCETRMNPPPEIKWFHENKRIRSSIIADANHIAINHVTRHDGGRYQCLVEDGSKDPPVEAINVIVNHAPEIEAKSETVHTGLGVESDLTCFVHAHPHAEVKWYKGQRQIIEEKGKIEIKGNKTWHFLEILHTGQQDFGEYKCEAKNRLGRAEKIIYVTGAPSQPDIYGGEMSATNSNLVLKWRLESYSPITEYKLEYRRKGDDTWNVVKPTVTNGKGNQFTVEYPIEGLQPGTYEAVLSARNDFGWSKPSVPHTFTGEYAMQENGTGADVAENVKGAAATCRPLAAIVTLFLVLSSCAFTSL